MSGYTVVWLKFDLIQTVLMQLEHIQDLELEGWTPSFEEIIKNSKHFQTSSEIAILY